MLALGEWELRRSEARGRLPFALTPRRIHSRIQVRCAAQQDIKEKAMSYATMQDVSFALVTDCELRDRPRQHLEPELPKEEPDRSRRATPKAAIKPKAASSHRARSLRRGLDGPLKLTDH